MHVGFHQHVCHTICQSIVSAGPPVCQPASGSFVVLYQEGTRKALLASLNKNPQTAWVKGPNGKHTNVSALLDWPDNSDESDSETMTSPQNGVVVTSSDSSHSGVQSVPETASEQDDNATPASTGNIYMNVCLYLFVMFL